MVGTWNITGGTTASQTAGNLPAFYGIAYSSNQGVYTGIAVGATARAAARGPSPTPKHQRMPKHWLRWQSKCMLLN